ncbi:MAG: TetR/AcrR family transcriptional regulator [Anaerolineae bacterium]|nr:TetR/AcrR family transcriptional regulator [Anaerolineae bacterium]
MSSTRDQIIEATAELLEKQGYRATGLNQIVEESGAPKGSLYYYFPGGKEEFGTEAVNKVAQEVHQRIETSLAAIEDPGEAVAAFILRVAQHVRTSNFLKGGPITSVALDACTTSERLNEVCRETYDLWQSAFVEKLVRSGFSLARSKRLAGLIIASIEGAIVLSRTNRSSEPLEHIAAELKLLLQTTHPK